MPARLGLQLVVGHVSQQLLDGAGKQARITGELSSLIRMTCEEYGPVGDPGLMLVPSEGHRREKLRSRHIR